MSIELLANSSKHFCGERWKDVSKHEIRVCKISLKLGKPFESNAILNLISDLWKNEWKAREKNMEGKQIPSGIGEIQFCLFTPSAWCCYFVTCYPCNLLCDAWRFVDFSKRVLYVWGVGGVTTERYFMYSWISMINYNEIWCNYSGGKP